MSYSLSGRGIYPKAYENFFSGNIDIYSVILAGDFGVALVDNSYSPTSTDEFWDDGTILPDSVAAIYYITQSTGAQTPVGNGINLWNTDGSEQATGYQQGAFLSASATIFPSVNPSADAGTVGNIVMFCSGTAGVDDYLIGIMTTDSTGAGIAINPDGDNITISWDGGAWANVFRGDIFAWRFGYC